MTDSRSAYCSHCGRQTRTGSVYCDECGQELLVTEQPVPRASRPASDPPARSRSIGLLGAALLFVLIGVGAGMMLFFNARSAQEAGGKAIQDNLEQSMTAAATPTQTPTSTVPVLATETYEPAELAAAFGDAVFRVETQGCGFEGIGSAFAISDRYLVTNWHVVAMDVTPVLRSRSGTTTTGRVIGWSEDPDIAVIEVQSDLEVFLEWAETSDLTEGTELASLGYPLPDHDFSVTPGAVLSFVRKGNRRVAIRTDASVDRGSSGGPALTDQGTVAGVVTQIDPNWDGLQFVPLIFTYDALGDTIDSILKRPNRPNADCGDPLFTDVPQPIAEDPDGLDYPNPYDPFWAVILESLEVSEFTITDALVRATGYWDLSIPAEVLLSSDFPSLNPGYWVLYIREFSTQQAASDYCASIRSIVDFCYARYVTWDSSTR